jgi:hypothetical protein
MLSASFSCVKEKTSEFFLYEACIFASGKLGHFESL